MHDDKTAGVQVAPTALTVRVDPALRARFKVACVKQGRSMNDVLAGFISWYVEKREADDG